jgi:hypothetical protein
MTVWRNTKAEDYWAAGKAMSEDLKKAKLDPHAWPRPAKAVEPEKRDEFGLDLDDEVPF